VDEGGFERQVQALLTRGQHDAAAELTIREQGPAVLGYLRAVVRELDDADDAFARFAETLWSSLSGFRGDCSMKTWAHRIAFQSALRILQDPYRKRRAPLPTTNASRIAAEVRNASSLAREAAVPARVEKLRQALTPAEHTLVILRFDRGLSWGEIALAMAGDGEPVDEAALRKRFERLKNRLRELATHEGLLDS
jgi:RNA polymerase sigma-70 factor (ECF subfamily)